MADESIYRPASLGRLWFGILAAPAAWTLMELVGYVLASQSCTPGQNGLGAYGFSHPRFAVMVLDTITALVAVAGLYIAYGNSQNVSQQDHLSVQGRERFMALAGILVSALFLLGILFFGIPPAFVNTCSEVR